MGHHRYSTGADRLGIASAVICTIHCLIVPALFLLKYWWTNSEGQALFGASGLPIWWESIDYLFLVVGFIAVYHASGHAPARGVRISLWFFWCCLAVAVIFEHSLHWMAYIASAGLVTTHFINIRKHKKFTPIPEKAA